MDSLQRLCTQLFRASMVSAAQGRQDPEQASLTLQVLKNINDAVASVVEEAAGPAAVPVDVVVTALGLVVQSVGMYCEKDPFARRSGRHREASLRILQQCLTAAVHLAASSAGDGLRPDGTAPWRPTARSWVFLSEDVYRSCVGACEVVLSLCLPRPTDSGQQQSATTSTSEEERLYAAEVLRALLDLLALELPVGANAAPPTASNTGVTSGGGSAAQRILAELVDWRASGPRVGFWLSTLLQFAVTEKSVQLRVACLRWAQRLFQPFDVLLTPPAAEAAAAAAATFLTDASSRDSRGGVIASPADGSSAAGSGGGAAGGDGRRGQVDGTASHVSKTRITYLWRFVPGVMSKVFAVVKSGCDTRRHSRVLVAGLDLWAVVLRECLSAADVPAVREFARRETNRHSLEARMAQLFREQQRTHREQQQQQPEQQEQQQKQQQKQQKPERPEAGLAPTDAQPATALDFFTGGGGGGVGLGPDDDNSPPMSWVAQTTTNLGLLVSDGLQRLHVVQHRGAQLAGYRLAGTVVGDCGLSLMQVRPRLTS
jgi:hypothetical protein